jgi:hypothetical protein
MSREGLCHYLSHSIPASKLITLSVLEVTISALYVAVMDSVETFANIYMDFWNMVSPSHCMCDNSSSFHSGQLVFWAEAFYFCCDAMQSSKWLTFRCPEDGGDVFLRNVGNHLQD